MNQEAFAAVAEFMGALAVIGSLLYLAAHVRAPAVVQVYLSNGSFGP